MPVQFGKDADGCFARWGEAGKPYYFECGNDAAQAAAAAKAQQQGAAIEANTAQADESADVAVDGAIEVAIEPTPDEPAPPKHIKIRLNDPAHFSAYQTVPYRRTPDGKNDTESDGVQVSYGIWKKTGAKTAQVYLFDREKGWDDAKVEAWFAARPQIPRPVTIPATQAVNETLVDIPATLAESSDSDYKVFAVHVIREGWGKNRRLGADGRYYRDYFPKSFLQALAPMLEGSAVQAVKLTKDETGALPANVEAAIAELRRHGHPPQAVNVLLDQGLIGNTVGFFRQAEFADNATQDETGQPRAVDRAMLFFADTPAAEQTRQLVKFAWNKGFKQSLGLSINYRANATFGEVEGRPAFIFDTPTHHVSTELVPNPAAHGGIVAVIQSMQDLNEQQDTIQGGAAATPEQPTPANAPTLDAPAAQAVTERVVEKIVVDEAAKAELAALKAQMAAFTQAQAEEKARRALDVLVTQSELDADSKQALLDEIAAGGLPTEQIVKSAITVAMKSRQVAIAATQAKQQATPFPGMTSLEMTADIADKIRVRSNLLWNIPLTQSDQDIVAKFGLKAFRGIQDEYKTLTHDDQLSFTWNPNFLEQMAGGIVAASQSTITTMTYPDIFRAQISNHLAKYWAGIEKPYLQMMKKGEDFDHTLPIDEIVLGRLGVYEEVGETQEYGTLSAPAKRTVRSVVMKRGGIMPFSQDVIINNQTQLVKETADLMAMGMSDTLADVTYKKFCGFGTAFNDLDLQDEDGDILGVPNGVLYHALRNNTVNGNVTSYTDMQALIDLMLDQTDIGDSGIGFSLLPYIAVTNIIYRGYVNNRFNAEKDPVNTDLPNMVQTRIPLERIIGLPKSALHGKPTALILLPNPEVSPAMEIAYYNGKTAPDLIWEGSQLPQHGQAFMQDLYLLKISMRARITMKRPRFCFCLYPS